MNGSEICEVFFIKNYYVCLLVVFYIYLVYCCVVCCCLCVVYGRLFSLVTYSVNFVFE